MTVSAAGTVRMIAAYQRRLIRHLVNRPNQTRSPSRPSAAAVTRKADRIGPRYAPGSTPRSWVVPRADGKEKCQTPRPFSERTYGVQATQLRANARVKNQSRGRRRR